MSSAFDPDDPFNFSDRHGGNSGGGQVGASWPSPSPRPPSGVASEVGGQPVWWLAMAGLLSVCGISVTAVVGRSPIAAVGWALSGPLAIGALAVFSRLDVNRQSHETYSEFGWARMVYVLVVLAAGVGIALGAWELANVGARL